MTIHVAALMLIVFKLAIYLLGESVLFGLICCPINDKEPSNTQLAIFLVISLVTFTLTFTDFITFVQ